MSAYSSGSNGGNGTKSVIPFPNNGAPSDGNSVFDKLEGFVVATQRLEISYNQERERARKLDLQVREIHSRYDTLLRDAEIKNKELNIRTHRAEEQITHEQNQRKTLLGKAQQIALELKKFRAENEKFRAAWKGLQEREREAKSVLRESETGAQRLAQLETACRGLNEALENEKKKTTQLERHSTSYQLELNNALVRLHGAEAKFSELTKEYQTLAAARKSMDDELAKMESSLRERFKWEVAKERENIRAQVEKEAALDREKFRAAFRRDNDAEMERRLRTEREDSLGARSRLESEISLLKEQLSEAGRNESEKARSRVYHQLRAEIDTLTVQLANEQDNTSRERRRAQELEEQTKNAEKRALSLELELRARERAMAELEVKHELREAEAESVVQELRDRLKSSESAGTMVDAAMLAAESKRANERVERIEAELEEEKQKSIHAASLAQRKIEELQQSLRATPPEAPAAAKKPGLLERMRGSSNGDAAESFDQTLETTRLRMKLEAEIGKSQSLEQALLAEKGRFDQTAKLLEAEVARLRSSYPLHDLLTAKEGEIASLRSQLETADEAARFRIEGAIQALEGERVRLSGLVERSAQRCEEQFQRIERASEINTLLAGPPTDAVSSDDTIVIETRPPSDEELDAIEAGWEIHPIEGVRPEIRH